MEIEKYTLTGLTKKEVESIGSGRYFKAHWKKLSIPMFIGVFILIVSVMLPSDWWPKTLITAIGGIVFIVTYWVFVNEPSKAGSRYFKEVTGK